MTQAPPTPPPANAPSSIPSPGFPEHRQFLLDTIPNEALAPVGSPRTEWTVLRLLLLLCLVAPIFVMLGCVVEGWNEWSVFLPVLIQLIGAGFTFYWLFQVTPKSHTILQISKNMRSSFHQHFSTDPRAEDLEHTIKILERPTRTISHLTIDFLITKSPVKWSVLLLVGALGVSVIPLLDTSIKAEDVKDLRLAATVLGLIFGFLEFIRTAEKFLDEKRLDAAREWLQQIQDSRFPL